jgi:hypothetical protein
MDNDTWWVFCLSVFTNVLVVSSFYLVSDLRERGLFLLLMTVLFNLYAVFMLWICITPVDKAVAVGMKIMVPLDLFLCRVFPSTCCNE